MIVLFILIGLLGIAIAIWFVATCYSTMSKIPESKRMYPAWFCWMMLIPIAGYVFAWLVLPFSIPKSAAATAPHSDEVLRRSKTLFAIALACLIAGLVNACLSIVHIPLLGIAVFVLWIIYWAKLPGLKRALDQAAIKQP